MHPQSVNAVPVCPSQSLRAVSHRQRLVRHSCAAGSPRCGPRSEKSMPWDDCARPRAPPFASARSAAFLCALRRLARAPLAVCQEHVADRHAALVPPALPPRAHFHALNALALLPRHHAAHHRAGALAPTPATLGQRAAHPWHASRLGHRVGHEVDCLALAVLHHVLLNETSHRGRRRHLVRRRPQAPRLGPRRVAQPLAQHVRGPWRHLRVVALLLRHAQRTRGAPPASVGDRRVALLHGGTRRGRHVLRHALRCATLRRARTLGTVGGGRNAGASSAAGTACASAPPGRRRPSLKWGSLPWPSTSRSRPSCSRAARRPSTPAPVRGAAPATRAPTAKKGGL